MTGIKMIRLFLLTLFTLSSTALWSQEQPPPQKISAEKATPQQPSAQKPPDVMELGPEELMNLKVSTATRSLEVIEKTGASVTVITEDQIRKMGARNLIDILQLVPGLGITQNFVGQFEIESRGIKTLFAEKVLVMLDGQPIINQLTNGGFQWGFGSLVADNIKRVEIVRGPGSALYGANAFLAVINVITKDAKDVNGFLVSGRGGDFATYQPNLLFGKTLGKTDVAINYSYHNTNGFRGFMERDVVGVSGKTLYPETINDLDVKLGRKELTFHGHFASRRAGPFAGAANALNDESQQKYRDWFMNLKYQRKMSDKFTLEPKVYYTRSRFDNFWELFTEGAFNGAFPDGLLLNAQATTSRLGAEILGHYDFKDTNKAVFGVSLERQKQYDLVAKQNYDANTFAPLAGGFQDVTNDPNQVWGLEKSRSLYGLFAEDIWDVRKHLRLVLGARYDHYSDFGGTFNPRTALIWEFKEGYNLRVLYGSAFRDPTFGELYNKNNPVVLGNPETRGDWNV